GRDELPLAPDEYTGFTMTLLRLHAFRPEQPAALGGPGVQTGPAGRAREVVVGQGAGQGSFAGKPAPTGRVAAVAPVAPEAPPPAVSAPTPAPPAPPVGAGSPADAAPPAASATPPVGAGLSANAAPTSASVPSSVGAGLPANTAPTRAPSPPDARPAAPSRAPAQAAALDHDVPPWEDLPAEAYADDDGRPARSERMPAPEPEASSRPATESWARAPLVAPVPAEESAASASTGASGDASVLLA